MFMSKKLLLKIQGLLADFKIIDCDIFSHLRLQLFLPLPHFLHVRCDTWIPDHVDCRIPDELCSLPDEASRNGKNLSQRFNQRSKYRLVLASNREKNQKRF